MRNNFTLGKFVLKIIPISFMACLILIQAPAQAISEFFLDSEIPFYDPECQPQESTASSAGASDDIKSVYMVGDSITLGAKDYYGLEKKFKEKEIDATIAASGGAGLNHAGTTGTKKSGIQSIQDDKAKIKNADAVIIAHGTNNFPGELEGLLKKAVKEVRKHNESAKIFWVNTDTTSSTGDTLNGEKAYTAASAQKKNKIIDKQAKLLDFSVIDMKSANVPLSSDGIHPDYSEKGLGKWGKVVVDGALSNATNGAVSDAELDVDETSNCCPAGTSSATSAGLSGKDNVEKAFNFFKEQGLSDIQAAAIIGNLSQESSPEIEPMLIEGGRKSKNPSDAGSGGYGIVQWTPGEKVIGIAKDYGIDTPIHELETQLNVVIAEMKGTSPPGYKNIMKDFKKINNLTDAVVFFQDKYEAPGIPHTSNRINFAKEALKNYGDGTTTSTGGADSSLAGCSCQDPTAVSDVSGANPKNLSDFIKKYADSALAASQEAGIPYDAMLAQIAHESGLPLSQLAAKYNNFGGIKYTGEGKSTPPLSTQEAGIGTIMARFRAFDTAQEGLFEQAKFFVDNERYSKALNYPRNPSRFIDEIAKAGYATDPNYASSVKGMLKEVQRELRKQGKPLSKEVKPNKTPSGGDLSDSSISAADCAGVSGGEVIDGFAFPVGNLKKNQVGANNALPCKDKSGCHHDGTSAFDLGKAGSNGILGSKSEGLPVYAIEDGTIDNFRTTYNGLAGCPSFQLVGKSGWWYWYGHTKKATIKQGSKVKAGQKIAEIGPSRCASDSPPHLHIDRGTPKGHYGGSEGSRDPSINELINKLWEALP